MYREHLMDHYKDPRYYGTMDEPDVSHHEKNPSCGDEITVDIRIDDDMIDGLVFSGHGCAISTAAMSMLAEQLQGAKIDDVLRMSKDDMLELIGVELTTMRVKCGLLGLHTVKKALYKHLGQKMKGEW